MFSYLGIYLTLNKDKGIDFKLHRYQQIYKIINGTLKILTQT